MLSAILARLQAQCPSFQVVAEAPSGATLTTVGAAVAGAALNDLLDDVLQDVHPIEAIEGSGPATGNADGIYRQVSASPVDVDGVRIITEVVFVVTVRAAEYSDLVTALSAIESAVAASSYAISITGAMQDYDDKFNLRLVHLELTYAIPAVSGGTDWPALLVDVVDYQGQPPAEYPIEQDVSRTYRLVILTTGSNMLALHNEVKAALLGWPATEGDLPHYYRHGQNLTIPGGLSAWVDTYTDTTWYRQ